MWVMDRVFGIGGIGFDGLTARQSRHGHSLQRLVCSVGQNSPCKVSPHCSCRVTRYSGGPFLPGFSHVRSHRRPCSARRRCGGHLSDIEEDERGRRRHCCTGELQAAWLRFVEMRSAAGIEGSTVARRGTGRSGQGEFLKARVVEMHPPSHDHPGQASPLTA